MGKRPASLFDILETKTIAPTALLFSVKFCNFAKVINEKKENYIMERTIFNEAQREMLDAMSHINSPEELYELKHAISEFYARKADEEMEKLWQSGEWNEQTLKKMETVHYRTPYKQ